MNNYHYYEYSKNNPEEIFDKYYMEQIKPPLVIPKEMSKTNNLTEKNKRMIDCITTFDVLNSKGYSIEDKPVLDIITEIVEILTNTTNINYSSFSQYFMVYNSTYAYFKTLSKEDKINYVYEMLIKYCKERHNVYLSHGYTNVILQVMSDNYSHKRKSSLTIGKVLNILKPYGLKRISQVDSLDEENTYFLPDKGDNRLFEDFLKKYNLKMESRAIEQKKLPDIVFNCKGHFYICELKTMKGSGGGQNKQIVEIIYYIKFSENDSRFHYVSFLDGVYANELFEKNSPKIKSQRDDIEKALRANDKNYFVNTAGFNKLVNDIFN